MTKRTSTKEKRAEWRVYRTNDALDALLEETGGEVTPEVEALEDALAEDLDDLAEVAVGMIRDADAEVAKASTERARLGEVTAMQKRRKDRGRHLLRRVAEERGEDKFPVGTFKVRLQAGPPRAVHSFLDGIPPDVMDELHAAGLGRFDFKPDLKGILAELKKDMEVAGFSLEYPTDRTVVVK